MQEYILITDVSLNTYSIFRAKKTLNIILSYSLKKKFEIRQFIYKTIRFKFIMTHSTTTIGQKFQYKDQQSLLHITGAVYQLSCTCGKSYIGQTKRNLKFRLNEHKPSNSYKNDISKHLLENSSHLIDFNQLKILARDNNWRKLKIKKTLFIQKLQPQLNIDETSHQLFLFNT